MNKTEPTPRKLPSMADYLLRYDLKVMIEETHLDYDQAAAGIPRLLDQKDISARFRKPSAAKSNKEAHGQQ